MTGPAPAPGRRHEIRVYYEDTDFSGVVYHASYLRFLERGRTEYLRARGIHQQGVLEGRFGPPFAFAVARMNLAFLRPARMDDLVAVETELTRLGGASASLRQRIVRMDGELIGPELVTADVVVACVSDGKPARLPAWVRARLG